MSEEVFCFCIVLRNGSNKAYAVLVMVNYNIKRSTFFLLLVLLSKARRACSVGSSSPSLFDFIKIEDGVSTKVKARVNNQQPKRPQNGGGQQASGGGGHNGGKNAKGGGGQQEVWQAQINYLISKSRQDRKKNGSEDRDRGRRSTSHS
ncbi:hypothetical protein SARC_03468 [Sphaeroforma arctica JP610]|uniref:Uncharacterized protein n=1 Tax=Sphaeroforma arctica JP610 TaxID=667725 RepID=A0A0L0G5J1_9EUKA|nr:hypothetical protein SARC_03468 [Sphaeroforma arctica JP610]KNC84307.1 hypothetical protein SARC_03468 [Sphaeroforma arctica JP610]|eukprot:XP_014158209.1 hypothetical protein SARC_03468 [Sphaeroforma arctica JP610]